MKKLSRKNKRIIIWSVIALIVIVAAIGVFLSMTKTAPIPSLDEAQELLYTKAESLYGTGAGALMEQIGKKLDISVSNIDKNNGECIVTADITAPLIGYVIDANMDAVHALGEPDENGETMKSDAMKAEIAKLLSEWCAQAEAETVTLGVMLAEANGEWHVYADKDFANAVSGRLCTLSENLDGSEEKAEKRLLTCIEVKCDSERPDTRNQLEKNWDKIVSDFKLNFINEGRWKMIFRGLGTTLEITLFAGLMGIILGFVVAIIRVTHDKNGSLGFLNGICKVYLTIIRGTPVLIQLMIIYFVVLGPVGVPKVPVAIIAFGINSGAYVAEIVRGGIMSIDVGQIEAGRSLGLSYTQTMIQIVMPQAVKNVLPALANEFIVLLKETSVSAYIALEDLTRAGDKIRGATYSAFMPLIAVAIIYLAMVMILSYFVGKLERRLGKSDRR